MRNDEKIRILKLATRYPEGSIERRALTKIAKFEEGAAASSKKAADVKSEILKAMMVLFEAAERKFGKEAISGAFSGATTDVFGLKSSMTDLKKLHILLVHPVGDAAYDLSQGLRKGSSGGEPIQTDDPRSRYARGYGPRVLGVPRLDLSPEAAVWFAELKDAPGLSLARSVLVAKAKQYGVPLDLKKTIYAKFEEGKPADPTKNMSPEDAAEWKSQTEQNKDNFKEAALRTSITKLASSFPKGSSERSSLLKLLSGS